MNFVNLTMNSNNERNNPPPRRPVRPPQVQRRNVINLTANNNNNNRRAAVARPAAVPRRGAGAQRPRVNNNNNRPGPSRARPAELPHARQNNLNAQVAANAGNIVTRFGDFRLKPHQISACRLFVKPRTTGLLLYYKVGSGKTLASIAAAENLARAEGVNRTVLVVVPAPLQPNYENELDNANLPPRRRNMYEIKSFDVLHRMTPEERTALARGAVLIIDEVQNMRNPKSKKLESLLEASRVAHKRLLLSGTPVMNYPRDMAAALSLLNPRLQDQVLSAGRPGKNKFDKLFGIHGDQNPEQLEAMLRCTSLFYEPDAATTRAHYPTKTEHWVPVQLTVPQVRMQFELAMEDPGPARFDNLANYDGSLSPAFLTKPREINTRLNRHHPKIDEVVRRVTSEMRSPYGKCVVFSTYLDSALHRIAELLRAAGVGCAIYKGDVSVANKEAMVNEYNAYDPNHNTRRRNNRVLLLSDSGKEGIDLKNTTQVHVVEPAWNEEKIQQVIGRAVRYESHTGPVRHVDVFRYHAVLPPDYQRYLPFANDPGRNPTGGIQSLLFDNSADDVLRQYTTNKHRVNRAFLQRLVRISDDNLARCL